MENKGKHVVNSNNENLNYFDYKNKFGKTVVYEHY